MAKLKPLASSEKKITPEMEGGSSEDEKAKESPPPQRRVIWNKDRTKMILNDEDEESPQEKEE